MKEERKPVICPNCGKESLAEEKCPWCNYRLKKREHTYPRELYAFLEKEYKTDKNKVRCIKLGMREYGLSMKDAKEIADYIADEVYEEEQVKTPEEVEPAQSGKYSDFRFSFGQYFIHCMVFKILALFILEIWLWDLIVRTMGAGVVAAIFINVIAISVILLQWATASSAVIHTAGKLEYVYRTSINTEQYPKDDSRSYSWVRYVCSEVKRIDCIKETPFSFTIYGKIDVRIYDRGVSRGTYTCNKLKLKKMFQNQRQLMQRIQPKRERK